MIKRKWAKFSVDEVGKVAVRKRKETRKKEMIKMRVETNEIETKKTKKRSVKLGSVFLKDKQNWWTLIRLRKKGRGHK